MTARAFGPRMRCRGVVGGIRRVGPARSRRGPVARVLGRFGGGVPRVPQRALTDDLRDAHRQSFSTTIIGNEADLLSWPRRVRRVTADLAGDGRRRPQRCRRGHSRAAADNGDNGDHERSGDDPASTLEAAGKGRRVAQVHRRASAEGGGGGVGRSALSDPWLSARVPGSRRVWRRRRSTETGTPKSRTARSESSCSSRSTRVGPLALKPDESDNRVLRYLELGECGASTAGPASTFARRGDPIRHERREALVDGAGAQEAR